MGVIVVSVWYRRILSGWGQTLRLKRVGMNFRCQRTRVDHPEGHARCGGGRVGYPNVAWSSGREILEAKPPKSDREMNPREGALSRRVVAGTISSDTVKVNSGTQRKDVNYVGGAKVMLGRQYISQGEILTSMRCRATHFLELPLGNV